VALRGSAVQATEDWLEAVLPDGPTARGAATSWRVYLVSLVRAMVVLPLVGK
jgi:hypothetical protein